MKSENQKRQVKLIKKSAAILSLLLFILSPFAFAETSAIPITTYDQLIKAIRETRQASEQRVETAVEQEKVREAWETGKLIDEHILLHKERAEYGKQVILRLSKDLEMSERELYYMLDFARGYPILPQGAELSWSHYRALLSVKDTKQREGLRKEAIESKWGRDRLRDEVEKRSPKTKVQTEKLPHVKPGKLHTYRIVKAAHGVYKGELVVDLGFAAYYKPEQGLKLEEGSLVSVERKENRYTLTQDPKLTPQDLYTYPAEVIEVIDGDTFHASLDLGFGFTMTQRVRLKHVDAPEILTSEGKAAKAYLEKLLAKSKGQILIQSSELDQHGRPLAIAWAGDTLVDQALLEKELVVKLTE